MGLEVRCAVVFWMLHSFGLARGSVSPREDGSGYRKVRTRPETQHSRFKSAIERLLPGCKSNVSCIFGFLCVALRHFLGKSLGVGSDRIGERDGGNREQRQRENDDPCGCRTQAKLWLVEKPASQLEHDEDWPRGYKDNGKRIAFGETSDIDRKNGGGDGGDPRWRAGCNVGEMQG